MDDMQNHRSEDLKRDPNDLGNVSLVSVAQAIESVFGYKIENAKHYEDVKVAYGYSMQEACVDAAKHVLTAMRTANLQLCPEKAKLGKPAKEIVEVAQTLRQYRLKVADSAAQHMKSEISTLLHMMPKQWATGSMTIPKPRFPMRLENDARNSHAIEVQVGETRTLVEAGQSITIEDACTLHSPDACKLNWARESEPKKVASLPRLDKQETKKKGWFW